MLIMFPEHFLGCTNDFPIDITLAINLVQPQDCQNIFYSEDNNNLIGISTSIIIYYFQFSLYIHYQIIIYRNYQYVKHAERRTIGDFISYCNYYKKIPVKAITCT